MTVTYNLHFSSGKLWSKSIYLQKKSWSKAQMSSGLKVTVETNGPNTTDCTAFLTDAVDNKTLVYLHFKLHIKQDILFI